MEITPVLSNYSIAKVQYIANQFLFENSGVKMSLKHYFKDVLKLKWPTLKYHLLKIVLLLLRPNKPSCSFFFPPSSEGKDILWLSCKSLTVYCYNWNADIVLTIMVKSASTQSQLLHRDTIKIPSDILAGEEGYCSNQYNSILFEIPLAIHKHSVFLHLHILSI